MNVCRWMLAAGAELAVVACLVAMPGGRAAAQSNWSADLGLEGGGVHGGEFRRDISETLAMGRLERRVLTVAKANLFVGVTTEQPFGEMAITTVCEIGSRGQCLEPPPQVRAFTAAIGLRRSLPARFSIGASGGMGEVFDSRWGNAHSASSGQFDLALRLFGPVHFTGGGRVVSWRAAGISLHSYTQLYGIRLN